jgi:hypothetical protein
MTDFIPDRLRARLGDERADRLEELLLTAERVLRDVYKMDAKDHDPDIGDNANLFGLKIWHHGWFALEHELEGWPDVRITHEDNSFRIRIWDLTIAVYKVGNSGADSIYDVNFDGSATKKAYAERNKAQLQLFPIEAIRTPEVDEAFALNDLWVAHFGNPREQLVKLYVGAPSLDESDHRQWAWCRRIDAPGADADAAHEPVAPAPFGDLPEPELALELEADAEENVAGGE